MAPRASSDARDPKHTEALRAQEPAWVPMFLARAAQGLTSVVLVATGADGGSTVALLAPVEASALLKRLGDTRGSAKVAGTPSPGTTWCVGLAGDEHAVWSLAMTAILSRGA